MTRAARPVAPPTIVFLDVGNVLVRWSAERLVRNLAALAGRPTDAVIAALRRPDTDPAYTEGRLSTDAFRARLGAALGVHLAAEAFARAWNDIFTRDPAAEALAARLAARLPCLALTNTNPLHLAHLRALVPVLGRLRGIVASHEVGVQKPSPVIFARACGEAGCTPGDALFVDDLAANVAAAGACGLRALHFTDVPALEAALVSAGCLDGDAP